MPPLREIRRFSLPAAVLEGPPKTIVLAAGSILDYHGDAFVNAANEGCVSGFEVDEVVNRAGGVKLKQTRKELRGCATGSAKMTGAFAHNRTRWIIHAVGPVYRVSLIRKKNEGGVQSGGAPKTVTDLNEDLRSAYRASFELARLNEMATLGFCFLSSGVFRGERDLSEVIEIGMRTVVEDLSATRSGEEDGEGCSSVREVTFAAYTDEEQVTATVVADRLYMEFGA